LKEVKGKKKKLQAITRQEGQMRGTQTDLQKHCISFRGGEKRGERLQSLGTSLSKKKEMSPNESVAKLSLSNRGNWPDNKPFGKRGEDRE